MFRVDSGVLGVSRDELIKALRAEGIPASFFDRHCLYEMPMFTRQSVYPSSQYPLATEQRSYRYFKGMCPVAEEVLRTSVVLRFNEFWSETDLVETIDGITKVIEAYYLAYQ
jgi:dTDP-4-amino-4,6-dideoxygalactose transaminase